VTETPRIGKWGYAVPSDLIKGCEGPLTSGGCRGILARLSATQATVPTAPTGAEILATMERFFRPTHTAIVHPDRADSVREATRDVLPRIEVVESPHVPTDALYLTDNKALEIPPPTLSWDSPAANPLADMRYWARVAASAPYQPFVPVLPARDAEVYRRELKRAEFRRKWERRFIDGRHLSPMRAAYWRRAKRRRRKT
jgi:hypothetical protein